MAENNERLGLLGLCLLFFVALLFVRKKIAYPSCTLKRYAGKTGRGKSAYLLLFHLITSLGLALACYSILDRNSGISKFFEDTFIRLITIITSWFFWIMITGWLIEMYLQATDKEYKEWKTKYLTK